MIKRLLRLWALGSILTFFFLMPGIALASNISSAIFTSTITITNNSTSNATAVIVPFTANTSAMITQGILQSDAIDSALTNGGTDIPYMPQPSSKNWWLFIPSLDPYSSITYNLYTGGGTTMNSALSYFPGSTGMTTTDNDTNLEPSSNFTITQTGGLNTDNGTNKNLVSKASALSLFVSSRVADNVTAWIVGGGIDVGSAAIDRAGTTSANETLIDLTNSANATGVIETVSLWFTTNATDVRVGTFYLSGGATYVCRDSAYIGSVTSGSAQTFSGLDISVVVGDFMGCYYLTGTIETDGSGGSGVEFIAGDFANPGNSASYAPYTNCKMSEYGLGYEITSISATGVPSADHTVTLSQTYALQYASASSQQTTISDQNDFSFTNGGGVDTSATVLAWVSRSDSGSVRGMLAKKNEWYIYTRSIADGDFSILFENGINSIGCTSAAGVIPINTPTQIGFSYDGSKTAAGITLYVNGAPISSTATGSGSYVGMANSTQNLYIGQDGWGVYMEGDLSDVKIWKGTALSATQCLADYNGTTSTTNLVGWWKMNEGGGLPQDYSGKGYHATGNTGTWITGILKLTIDNVLKGATQGYPVTNNGNNWAFAENGAFDYLTSQSITIAGVERQRITYQYATTFSDQSGNGNSAVPSFPTSPSNPLVEASMKSQQPLNPSQVGSFSLTSNTQSILSNNTSMPSRMWLDSDYSKLLGVGAAVSALLAVSNTPPIAWWFSLIYIGIAIISMILYQATTGVRKISEDPKAIGSLLLMAGVIEALFAFLALLGPLPFWPIFLFPVSAAAIIMSRKHYGWG